MKPPIVLLSVFALSLILFKIFTGEWKYVISGNIAMCCMLLFTSVAHFAFTKGMVMMMPSIIPFKKEMVYLTGVLELLLAIGLALPQTRYIASIIIIIFFIILLPANISAAAMHVNIKKADFTGKGVRIFMV
ncbi:MAG: DoxX family protein [Chitinophagaceae bacterium]